LDFFSDIVRRTINIGKNVGAFFLVAVAVLTVSNVIYRFFGKVIVGSYELNEFMIVVVIGFALAYAALTKEHIIIDMVVSRFRKRAQAIAVIFSSLLGMVVLGVMVGAPVFYLLKRGFSGEAYTDVLRLPFFPLKCVWVFALVLFGLVFLIDLFKALKQALRK
jgi:TRAP-type C4-dicarboxylate transport system permease small subunit